MYVGLRYYNMRVRKRNARVAWNLLYYVYVARFALYAFKGQEVIKFLYLYNTLITKNILPGYITLDWIHKIPGI